KSNQLGSVRKSDKKFYKKFKKYQKIKIGACSCVAGLLLRSKVNTLKPHFVREKKSTSWWISTPLFFCPYSLQALPMVQWL
ncbi:hypothetical protein, partial [Dialister hominis]